MKSAINSQNSHRTSIKIHSLDVWFEFYFATVNRQAVSPPATKALEVSNHSFLLHLLLPPTWARTLRTQ